MQRFIPQSFKKYCALSLLFISPILSASDQAWLKIENPDQSTRSQLSSKAINYGSFIWVNKSDTESLDLTKAKRVTTYEKPYMLIAGNQLFDPLQAIPNDGGWFKSLSSANHDFHLIQFNGPIKSEWLASLKDIGIKPLKSIYPFSYIVWANQEQITQSRQLNSVRWGGYLFSSFKVQPNNRSLSSSMKNSMALLYRPVEQTTIQMMKSAGAKNIQSRVINRDFVAISFEVPGNLYQTVANISGVLTVQQIQNDGGPRSEMSQQSIVGNYDASNVISPGYQSWLDAAGVDGSGVTVGVVDGGIFEEHPDLDGKILPCTGPGRSCGTAVDGHGTHVAGAIGATGASGVTDDNGFLRGQGVAPGANIVEQLYGPLLGAGPGSMVPGGMLEIYRDSSISGAVLTNNSWGPTGTPQGYDIPTMEIDIISRDADPDVQGNQPVLAVWSIMNGGGDSLSACEPSSLGSPDEAKNLFAVGSTKLQNGSLDQTTDIFDISSNSAHGPACDGRQVPHIVAPGCSTDAPVSATGYGTLCGTSMASPVISGSVSLFWEQYRNNFSRDPSPALVKATFTAIAKNLNGFRDADGNVMGNAPDRKQGWGRVDLDAVINPPQNVWYYDQRTLLTETGQQWMRTIEVDDANEPVRIMLVWTDAAGTGMGGTTPAWVNDLDLTVNTSSESFLGNVFGADAYSEAGGTADMMNNMEGIFLRADQHAGANFQIQVTAANITADAINPYNPSTFKQDFALVCYNCRAVPLPDPIFGNSFEMVQ